MAKVTTPHYSRDLRRHRIKRDPEYAKVELRRSRAYVAEKIRRAPQYAEVVKLCHRLHNLRELVKRRRNRLATAERELIAKAKRYNDLRERCRGK